MVYFNYCWFNVMDGLNKMYCLRNVIKLKPDRARICKRSKQTNKGICSHSV